ncbi:MAG: hypothetical protein QNK37_36950 [Acidobacteriota bacterium]|nr:hypothetical protein [Acidobacteriota bacterium]
MQNDLRAAEREALEQALRSAVEQVVADVLPNDVFAERYETVERHIFLQAADYVAKYEVLQSRTRGNIRHVTLKAEVKRAAIEIKLTDLGLLSAADMPRIAVLMVDKNAAPESGQAVLGGVAQARLAACFLKRGFVVLDLEQVKRNMKREELDALLSLDEEKASALGLRLNVDLLVAGESRTAEAGDSPLEGFKVASCVIQCRVFYADNGRLLASKHVDLNATGISSLQASARALENGADKLCGDLTQAVDAFWRKQRSGPRTFTLVLSGADYGELRKIQEYLRGLSGTLSVTEREFNAAQAVLDVSFNNRPIEYLLDAMLSNKCPVQGWALRLKSGNALNLTRKY